MNMYYRSAPLTLCHKHFYHIQWAWRDVVQRCNEGITPFGVTNSVFKLRNLIRFVDLVFKWSFWGLKGSIEVHNLRQNSNV